MTEPTGTLAPSPSGTGCELPGSVTVTEPLLVPSPTLRPSTGGASGGRSTEVRSRGSSIAPGSTVVGSVTPPVGSVPPSPLPPDPPLPPPGGGTTGATYSYAPMSGRAPDERALPSGSLVPRFGAVAEPASIVGEPSSGVNRPPARLVNSGAESWLPRPGVTPLDEPVR